MANREVNLTKRVQTTKGWRYCRVVLSANGRVRPDVFLVDGKQETHKEGAYYLEWRDGAKRVRLSVGKDPADASFLSQLARIVRRVPGTLACKRRTPGAKPKRWELSRDKQAQKHPAQIFRRK